MRVLGSVVRALPMTFVIYVTEAVLALAATLPLGLELLDDERPSLSDSVGRAMLLEYAHSLLPTLRVHGRSVLMIALLLALLSPWLQMSWLCALSRPSGVVEALRVGFRVYGRAGAISFWTILLTATAAVPCWLAVDWLDDALSHQLDERLYQLAMVAASLPLLWVVCSGFLVHDLARARALRTPALSAMAVGVRTAFKLRVQLLAMMCVSLGLLIRLGPLWSARHLATTWLTTALLQAAVFAALLLRSAWLAYSLACTDLVPTSREDDE